MTRRRTRLALVSALVAVAVGGTSCTHAAASGIAVAGDTRVDLVTVAAPRLGYPTVDVTVGIAKSQTPAALAIARKKAAAAAAAAAANRAPVAAGLVSSVKVRAGDRVKKGQVVATLDTRLLDLGVDSAEAAFRRAVATADTLHANALTLRDTRATAAAAGRAGLATGQAKLDAALAGLSANVAKLRAGIAASEAALAQARAALAGAEKLAESPHPPPGIQQTIASLKRAITAIQPKIAQLRALEATLLAAQRTAKTAGAGQLAAGRRKLASALAKISSGITTLENLSDIARIASGAQAAGVDLARQARDQATLRSPVDGVVVSAMPGGQIAMVGAPVVVIRPKGTTLVDTYVAPEDIGRVRVGDRADVTLDSVHGVLQGAVATVWPDQTFPPTNYPTQIVHLSRVVRVTVSVRDGDLPLGVPADVIIHPSS